MNLLDLFVKITAQDEASDKIGGIASKIGGALKGAAKVAGAAVAAGTAALAGLGKQAVESYANYEQLVGGVETLFKDSAPVIQEFAANAFKTAGLSANDYMQTVTSFSAALINSVGGDTARAAELANTAITDMSDNANKMGTSIESLQNAYTGFSRGNYTMLDNLALGFSGTKEGMQELLDKARELSGVEYDISSYADIVEAIHVVQTEMGITGTTAKEAASTISGSVSAMKSAWKNLITGMADDNADFDQLMQNFVDSAVTAGENIIPRIETTIQGLSEFISASSETIIPLVVDTIVANLPALLDAGFQLVTALAEAIIQNAPAIFTAVAELIAQTLTYLLDARDQFAETVQEWLSGMGEKFNEAWANFLAAGDALIQAVGQGIAEAWATLVENVSTYLSELWDTAVQKAQEFISVGSGIVQSIRDGIASAWDSVVSWVSGLIDGLRSRISSAVSSIGAGHAGGLDYVPYNGYVTQLHRGEMVLTAREAQNYRGGNSGGGGGNIIENVTFEVAAVMDTATVARKTYTYNLQQNEFHGQKLINA